MGPWIDTDFTPNNATTTVKVNGVAKTVYKTNSMIFDVPTFLVEITKYLTLWPGDVMWMGTDGSSPDLKHGDLVEVEILTGEFPAPPTPSEIFLDADSMAVYLACQEIKALLRKPTAPPAR
jgi:hypothetical protein